MEQKTEKLLVEVLLETLNFFKRLESKNQLEEFERELSETLRRKGYLIPHRRRKQPWS